MTLSLFFTVWSLIAFLFLTQVRSANIEVLNFTQLSPASSAVYCSLGYDGCFINCTGDLSCSQTSFYCPTDNPNADCSILCSGFNYTPFFFSVNITSQKNVFFCTTQKELCTFLHKKVSFVSQSVRHCVYSKCNMRYV